MKVLFLTTLLYLSLIIAGRAQAPGAFNYQGVARTGAGAPIAAATISLRLTILDGSSTGTPVYQETQSPTTNMFGLYNVAIGMGTPTGSATFAGVNWSTGNKYMEVEIDPAGGTDYTNIGTSQLLSVPYALFAATGGTGTVTAVTAGTGLTGGTITGSGTIGMPHVGIAGSYGSAFTVPVITTDSQGRVSAVTLDSVAGDNWGVQVAQTDTTLAGNGTTASPLRLARDGATTGQLMKWNGSAWAPATSDAWDLLGNAGTNSGTNFLGTRDTAALRFRVNSTWAGELNANTGNVSFGPSAGMATSGYSNTAMGTKALSANTTGYNNLGAGFGALAGNTTGFGNTATGDSALFYNTTGFSNTAAGVNAMEHNTTGVWNVAMGQGALQIGTSDSENTAIGAEVLIANTTGNANTGVGVVALNVNTTGKENTAVGEGAAYSNTTGSDNTAVGGFSLQSNTTGSFNTAVGYAADVSAGGLTNASALGSWAIVNASNKVVIGSSSVSTIGGYSSWTNLSDSRFKTDIRENVHGLDFITRLRPVTYRFQARKFEQFLGSKDEDILKRKESFDAAESIVRTGFIAQEVEQAAIATGYDFSGLHKPTGDKDNYSLAYSEFTVPLVKAVQELNAKNEQLERQLAALMQRIDELEKEKKK